MSVNDWIKVIPFVGVAVLVIGIMIGEGLRTKGKHE